MKKIMVALAMAGGQWLHAQSPKDSLSQKLSQIFSQVNPGQVASGRIFDKGLALTNPLYFSAQNPEKVDGSFQQFGLLYNTLQSASVDGRNPMPDLENLLAQSETYPRTSVPLFALDAGMQYLKDDALSAGHVRVDQETIIPISQNYGDFLEQADIVALSTPRRSAEGPEVTFVLPPDFTFADAGKAGLSIKIRQESENWITLGANGSAKITFSGSAGKKKVEYQLSRGTATISEGFFELTVAMGIATNDLEWVVPAQMGSHSGGRITIDFANNNSSGHLRRPIIILEGVDYHQVAPDLIESNWSWENSERLFKKIRNDFNLIGQYDFVYVDYFQGADAIERNAALFRDVIRKVNEDMGSEQGPSVVIGFSMGGLVARYALSQMVKSGEETRVKTLITHDSPHQGANMPLGVQFLFKKIYENFGWTGLFPQLQQASAMFSAPASQQMLLYRATDSESWQANTWLSSVYTPVITFPSGTSVPFETVATSLGSECGVPGFPSGQSLLRFDGRLGYYNLFNPLDLAFFGRSDWRLEMQSWASQTNVGNRIARIRLSVKRKILNLLPITVNILTWSKFSPSGLAFVDGVQGGYYPMNEFASLVLPGFDIALASLRTELTMAKGFTFIPVKSGLDVDGNSTQAYTRVYNTWNPPPVGSRIAIFRPVEPVNNEQNLAHVNLSPLQADFMNRKIRGLPLGSSLCPGACGVVTGIEGPNSICPGSSGSFTLNPPPSPLYNYTWNVSSGGNVVSGQGSITAQIQVSAGNTIPNISVGVNISQPGCINTLNYTINGLSDIPDLSIICSNQSNAIVGSGMICKAPPSYSPSDMFFILNQFPNQGNYNVTWSPLFGNNGQAPTLEPDLFFGYAKAAKINTNGADPLRFKIKAESSCGVKERTVELTYPNYTNGTYCFWCSNTTFSIVSPDPAIKGQDEYVTLQLSDKVELPAEGWIEDQRGNRMQAFGIEGRHTQVSIGKLEPARYKMVAVSGIQREEVDFVVARTGGDKMVISPNPVFKDVDYSVEIGIVGNETEDNHFEVTVETISGERVKQFVVEGRNFTMDVSDMGVGSYVVTVKGQTTLFQENLELTMKGKPYLFVSPNPAMVSAIAEVVNPLIPDSKWEVELRDKLGVSVRKWISYQNPISFEVGDLLPDLYYLQVQNGKEFYTKIFRKN